MYWKKEALEHIERIHRELPEKATLKERRAALRAHASFFHCGTSWGKKVWSRECRAYLEKHGQPTKRLERSIAARSKQALRLSAGLESGDIELPFRGQA